MQAKTYYVLALHLLLYCASSALSRLSPSMHLAILPDMPGSAYNGAWTLPSLSIEELRGRFRLSIRSRPIEGLSHARRVFEGEVDTYYATKSPL